MGLIHDALSRRGAVLQSKNITENGTFYPDSGFDGLSFVVVDVPIGKDPVIQSLSVSCNGVYTAPEGVDGYNPVTVNSPYETLYKLEHGLTEPIDTGVTDESGEEIIIGGLPVDNMNQLVNTAMLEGDMSVSFVLVAGGEVVRFDCRMIKDSGTLTPCLTLTNVRTGQNVTKKGHTFDDSYTLYSPYITLDSFNIAFKSTFASASSWIPYDGSIGAYFSEVGISEIPEYGYGQIYALDIETL